MKTIYTYYEDVSGGRYANTDNERLLGVWRRSWERRGWRTVVLGREDAMKNPKYGEYENRFMRYPSKNDRRYELACFLRWVAMEERGGYHCDFDVMNNGFDGEHGDGLTFYSKFLVPAMTWGTKEDYGRMLELFMSYDYEGKDHVSDQSILVENASRFEYVHRYMMPEIEQEDNWFEYELTHYPNTQMTALELHPRWRVVEMLDRMIWEMRRR